MYLNHAATNPVFSFLSSVVHTDGLNDYNYQTDAAVEKDFVHYSQPVASDTLSQSVLNTTRPNVVLVIMESYCRTLSDEKVKGEWVGGNLHRLSKEGIWFENFIPILSVPTGNSGPAQWFSRTAQYVHFKRTQQVYPPLLGGPLFGKSRLLILLFVWG